MNKRPIFHEHPLRGVLEVQQRKLDERIANLPSEQVRTADLDQLAQALYDEFRANPIVLQVHDIAVEQADVKLDLRGDVDTSFRDGPYLVDGIRVRYYVPFDGDEVLLDCQPSTFTLVWPRVAEIKNAEIVFEYDRPDRSVEASKAVFDSELGAVKQWVGWSASEVQMFNDSLPPRIRNALAARRERLGAGQGDVAKLGLKVRAPAPEPAHAPWQPPPRAASAPIPQPKGRKQAVPLSKPEPEYDVALSFAGEDREYVERVATALKAAGVRVFYDRFEELKLWGRDLAEHFARIYGDGSRFIVLFGSEHYAAKAWPTFERRQALAKSIRQHQEVVILPVRFDDTEVPGLTDTRAYLDARMVSADELAKKIISKIQLES